MTIKDLALVAGVSEDTIRRKGKELFPGMHKKGVKVHYTKNQCERLMREVKKKNMVSELPQNAEVSPHNAEVDYQKLSKMIEISVSAAVSSVLKGFEENIFPKYFETIERRLSVIEKKSTEQEKKALPAPMIETRQLVNKAVNDFARMKGGSHTAVWNELYRWYDYYNHTNVKLSAKNRRMKTIDYVEKIGMMENLLSVAEKVFF